MKELIIGSHVSFNKAQQLLGSLEEALSYGADTFMIYTGAPQNTFRTSINKELTAIAHTKMQENNIDYNNVIVHAPYIINLANSANKDFACSFLKQELARVEALGLNKIVLHSGSHVGLGIDIGIINIVEVLNNVLASPIPVTILLETMAGKGNEIGSNFNELKRIIDGVENKQNIGVCLDTCHLNDAGYDLTKIDDILDEFDNTIGLERLKCIHINDSKNIIGSHKDRHANIGYGTIGFKTLLNIVHNTRLKHIPFILETPYIEDTPPYKEEILMLKTKEFNHNLLENKKD